ncbi:retron St85 family RNA-directed DNA polymerase [Rahnella inusitata]|uniref:RNA-directed DNA polymerase n=1 Tax=Rahnella inusitata TaxID=58169 RepID=A0ABX9P5Q7_9GAMM|nr:retron St85 family RNA-directed DNA polymerase [Rahnella inusitata]RJT15666.1 RNA-directed DNA polymerase [Rahnella inusitata]
MSYLDEIANYLDKSVPYLIKNYISAPREYKVFYINKKNSSEKREVAQPSKEIKEIQRAIVKTLLETIPIHSCAKAYMKNSSIYDNALPHKDNAFLLKMDFRNFFPSIKPSDFLYFLEKNGLVFGAFESTIITNYLFWRRKGERKLSLCIGAPSSPIISNIVMHDVDSEINSYCEKEGILYTRYADDLTFSADNIEKLEMIHSFISTLINKTENPKLLINKEKTRYIGKGRSKRVTGVVITHEGELGVGRYLRKKIRAMIYLYSQNKLKREDIPYLHGMLSHINNIEHDYYIKLKYQYGSEMFKVLYQESLCISKEIKSANFK